MCYRTFKKFGFERLANDDKKTRPQNATGLFSMSRNVGAESLVTESMSASKAVSKTMSEAMSEAAMAETVSETKVVMIVEVAKGLVSLESVPRSKALTAT